MGKWHYLHDGQQQGPVSEAELLKMISDGLLNEESSVWSEGMDEWKKIKDTPEIANRIIQRPAVIASRWPSLFFILMGGVALAIGAWLFIRSSESRSWPNVPGVVTTSRVVSERRESRDSDGYRVNTQYSARIVYEYEVDGRRIKGDRVKFGQGSSNIQSLALRVTNKYPQGKEVPVYYNPADPEQSVLEPGVTFFAVLVPAIGLLFFGIGIWLFVANPKLTGIVTTGRGRRKTFLHDLADLIHRHTSN